MPRKVTNQWDFGELFPPAAVRRIFSVTELTARIKGVLEGEIGEIWVSGEVTNLRVQASGHIYFALKDPNAQLSCVLFRGVTVADRAAVKDGQRVTVQGNVTVYEPRGQYQLIVRSVEVQGIGALQAAFERLKEKLNAEGLFDPARKRPLPRFPRRIGLVTSPTGAALRDVLHVLGRRYAGLDVVLAPCRVQGQGAELEIAAAIVALNAWAGQEPAHYLDVLVVTRGGGSLEDLWAFNEETVARAIAGSRIPVVSAVGHEIDFTIADFVADLRAATPSAAAEILTAGYVEARDWVVCQAQRLGRLTETLALRKAEAAMGLTARLRRAHPRRRLEERMQRLDEIEAAFVAVGREMLLVFERRRAMAAIRLAALRPARRIQWERHQLQRNRERLEVGRLDQWRRLREAADRLDLRLKLLSPEKILSRGFSITMDERTREVIRDSRNASPGQRLRTRLQFGEVPSVVTPGGTTKGRAIRGRT